MITNFPGFDVVLILLLNVAQYAPYFGIIRACLQQKQDFLTLETATSSCKYIFLNILTSFYLFVMHVYIHGLVQARQQKVWGFHFFTVADYLQPLLHEVLRQLLLVQ